MKVGFKGVNMFSSWRWGIDIIFFLFLHKSSKLFGWKQVRFLSYGIIMMSIAANQWQSYFLTNQDCEKGAECVWSKYSDAFFPLNVNKSVLLPVFGCFGVHVEPVSLSNHTLTGLILLAVNQHLWTFYRQKMTTVPLESAEEREWL